MNLLASEDRGQCVVVLGADLPKDGPAGVTQQVVKKLTGSGDGLADGFGLPTLFKFDEQEVVAQLGLGELGWVAAEVLVQQAQLTVIGVAGAIGVVAQGQSLGELSHGIEGMLVFYRVDILSSGGSDGGGRRWRRGRTSRLLGLGASERLGVLEVFGMNGVWICVFHTPPIL